MSVLPNTASNTVIETHYSPKQPDTVLSADNASNNSPYCTLNELIKLQFHVKHRRLKHQQQVLMQVNGNHHAIRKGRGMTFSEVRPYQNGDDIRHIDWRVSARTQKIHTKLFVEEPEKPTLFIIEQTPVMFFGSQTQLKSQQALKVASLLSWIALNQGDKVGGLVFNQGQTNWIKPLKQTHSVHQLLKTAVEAQNQLTQPDLVASQSWIQALEQLSHSVSPGSKVFLIGDLFGLQSPNNPDQNTAFNLLQQMRKKVDISAIHINDPIEKTISANSALSFLDSDQQSIEISAQQKAVQTAYSNQYEQDLQQLKNAFAKMNAALVEVETTDDALHKLMHVGLIQ